MDPLNRKLVRELWQMRGQALAIMLVIAAGTATYVMARCTMGSLHGTLDAYYTSHRFADVFASLKRPHVRFSANWKRFPACKKWKLVWWFP